MKTVEFCTLFDFIRNGMNVRQDKSGDGLPITRIETISEAVVDDTRVGYAGLLESDCAGWLLQPGDILFSHINSVEHIGKCAVYEGKPSKLVHGMNLLCLRPDREKLDPQFGKYLIRSQAFRKRLSNFVNKAVNQASVSIGNLKTIPVPLPPLPEQCRIAAILDKADAIRRKRQEAIRLTEEFLRSVFLDMFGDPVTNPKGWDVVKIRDLVSEVKYGTSGKASYEGSYPILRMNNITYEGGWNFSDLKRIDIPVKDLSKYTVQKGDILFNRTNSKELVGKTAVYREEHAMVFAGYLIRIRPNSDGNSEYISAYLNSSHGKTTLSGMCKSIVGMANINAQELQEIDILKPPKKLQDNFASIVHAVINSRVAFLNSLNQSESLFNSLVQRAFRGEL